MLAADVPDDGLVEFVARDLDALGDDDAVEGEDRDVRGAAADVDDHVADGTGDVEPGSEGCRDGLLDEEDAARARLDGRVMDGALFHLGDARGDAYNQTGLEEGCPAGFLDEVLEHAEGEVVLADDAVPERPERDNIAGGASEHLLRFPAYGEELVGILVDGDNGRFLQYDSLALDIDKHRGGTEVDPDILAHAKWTLSEEIYRKRAGQNRPTRGKDGSSSIIQQEPSLCNGENKKSCVLRDGCCPESGMRGPRAIWGVFSAAGC